MSSVQHVYLDRYSVPNHYIDSSRYGNPDMVVVIPCHNEPDLISSLESLEQCSKSDANVSVIVVINAGTHHSESVKQQNLITYDQARKWLDSKERRLYYHLILDNELPKKHAGVGLARKIGMDEAVRVFESNHKDGVILCYDADSRCNPNYLVEVDKLFRDQTVTGCSIHYEHPLEGEFEDKIYKGIINYELHLRCYINLQILSAFPHAYQTIGSSMAVRSSVYQKQGGMNKKKAGEDFYFLHRIIPLGGFKNLTTTYVIPSPRVSDRVPFGTGKAIGDWINSPSSEYDTYSPKSFEVLKEFFAKVIDFYQAESLTVLYNELSTEIRSFLALDEFESKIKEINRHSSNKMTFFSRFYQWFDAFKLMKFIHHLRDQFYPNVTIEDCSEYLLDTLGYENVRRLSLKDRLLILRTHDRVVTQKEY